MKKIPAITTKIANDTLQPYFDSLYRDLAGMSDGTRPGQLLRYKSYIEAEAQKSSNKGVRMQLRINLQNMLTKLGETPQQVEVNVRPSPHGTKYPRFSDEAYTELFEVA